MALIDNLEKFAEKQIISKICRSQYGIALRNKADFGQNMFNRYVKLQTHGAFTTGLTVNLIASNSSDFSDEVTLSSTGEIAQGTLVSGYTTFLQIPATGQKYKYFALKFMPSGVVDQETTTVPEDYCPNTKVLDENTDTENCLSAFLVYTNNFNTEYEFSEA